MASVVVGALASAVGLSGLVSTVATSFLGAVSTFALSSLASKPKRSASVSASERSEMVRSPALPRRVVYGRCRVSGPLVFAATSDSSSKTKNDLLHLVIPLATHEVEALEGVFINDQYVPLEAASAGWLRPRAGSSYLKSTGESVLDVRFHQGNDGQNADEALCAAVPLWTYQHRLQGIAYIYVRLKWDSQLWSAGLPNISALILGKKVFDPRTGQTNFSSNPALCMRDYLASDYGLACLDDELDDSSFAAAAQLCDELVSVVGESDQHRFELHGVISLDQKPIDIMEQMLTSCGGALVYAQGQYKLYPASYRPPVLSLHEGLLRKALSLRPRASLTQKGSVVRGTFIDAAQNWQQADYTPVSKNDDSERQSVPFELDLPFTTNGVMARRLAKLHLTRLSASLSVEAPCTMAALPVQVMEPVRVTFPSLGWDEKTLLPVSWSMSVDGGIDLVLQEDDPSFYAVDETLTYALAAADVPLPALSPDVPLVVLQDGASVSGVAQVTVDMSGSPEAFVSRYDVEYRLKDTDPWISQHGGACQVIEGLDLWSVYEFRIRAINTLGRASLWALLDHQVVGDVTPPGVVGSLSGQVVDGHLYLEWPRTTGSVSGYRLRYSPRINEASWSGAVDVSGLISREAGSAVVPARQGSYLIKAFGPLGAESATPALYVNMAPDGRSTSVLAEVLESPYFTGQKQNCAVTEDGALVIDSLYAFDAHEGDFESLSALLFDSAGGGVAAEGLYQFANTIDLGAAYLVRIQMTADVGSLDLVSVFEDSTGDFDARLGVFDGESPSATDVVLEMSVTQGALSDVASWSSWQPCSVGDVPARGIKLRARLISQNPMMTPVVASLSARIDITDRILSGSVVNSAMAGVSLQFDPPFYAPPHLSVTGQNFLSGDRVVISSLTRTGAFVQVLNSSGAGTSRTFDWVARGFGRELLS